MKIEKCSISNGRGVRAVLWVSGCSLHCPGCFNPETWDFEAGKPFDNQAKELLFSILEKPYIKGLTISGGHPLEPQNEPVIYDLLVELRQRFGQTKDVWLYTGYTLEPGIALEEHPSLEMCDYIVDGPYIESQRDTSLAFRGSANQRILLRETLYEGKE